MGIIVGAVGYLLVQPVLKRNHKYSMGRNQKLINIEELQRKKGALLREIKDIELDFQMGKIDEADFKELTGGYRQQALSVMEELDDLDDAPGIKKAAISSEFEVPEEKRSGFCAECGSPLFKDAAFCGVCGTEV